MSRHAKPIDGDPLRVFLLAEFTTFAKAWTPQKDLRRLAFSFAANGHPMIGSPTLLDGLFAAAAYPDRLKDRSEESRLFLMAYGRAPDFVLGLLAHLRKKLSNASPHRKHLLFSETFDAGPKAIKSSMKQAVEEGAIKIERQRLRIKAESMAKKMDEINNHMGLPEKIRQKKKHPK
ncbi:MAG TPA: hypothetical protein VFC44_23630 [Candidatus Saccharimonadales bacterium]|nr:hypothetical protein [Candidatus Saccharimonadales bacterium]